MATKDVLGGEKLPRWDEEDLRDFAREDPQNARNLKILRRTGKFCMFSGVLGAALGSSFFYKNSRNPMAAAMGGAGGFVTGYLLGEEIPKFTFGTNAVDPLATHAAYQQWWVKRYRLEQQAAEEAAAAAEEQARAGEQGQ